VHMTRHKDTTKHPHRQSTAQAPHNKQPHQPPTGHKPLGHGRGRQMLASTIQISNNNPTPPHPNPRGVGRRHGGEH
jgi:hypothetical protein